jgi:hypothetical protein
LAYVHTYRDLPDHYTLAYCDTHVTIFSSILPNVRYVFVLLASDHAHVSKETGAAVLLPRKPRSFLVRSSKRTRDHMTCLSKTRHARIVCVLDESYLSFLEM